MDEKVKTIEEEFAESIVEKRKLVTKIRLQMAADAKHNIISTLTVQLNSMALDNLDAAALNLTQGEYEQAVHFFSRACNNMSEFKGRADKERGRV